MIEAGKRKAIYLLHKEGMGIREISRHMNISTNTVSTIIDQGGELPQTTRSDKIKIETGLVSRVYHQCDGRVQRTHEILGEEYGIDIYGCGLCQTGVPCESDPETMSTSLPCIR